MSQVQFDLGYERPAFPTLAEFLAGSTYAQRLAREHGWWRDTLAALDEEEDTCEH